MIEPQTITIDDWTLKVREPDYKPSRVIFLIHGWTGDESSMWVFASRFPRGALLIAPRAPYVSKHAEIGGYSWVEDRAEGFSPLESFAPAISKFAKLIEQLKIRYEADFESFGMAGFSQGAAFSAACAIRNAKRLKQLAMLAGFLPTGAEKVMNKSLVWLPVFMAHGVNDETVPIAKAYAARKAFETAGASVTFCESDTAHKLGAHCARELEEFFS